MFQLKYVFLIILLAVLITSCDESGIDEIKEDLTLDEARIMLPLYDNFLRYFLDRGYEFWSFSKYWDEDKKNLPEKLMVIRHDVHHRDIKYAYAAYLIEKSLLTDDCATYYVMIDFPPEMQKDNYLELKQDYLSFMTYLKERSVDIQPHISIWDEYIYKYNPWWREKSEEELVELKDEYYQIEYDNYYTINSIRTDSFHIFDLNDKVLSLLEDHQDRWFNYTGIQVKNHCSHGSSTAMNHVINNVVIMNQGFVRNSGLFDFETSSYEIRTNLNFLSDNNRPFWIEYPQDIEDGRYHLLMHPAVWEDPQSYRDLK